MTERLFYEDSYIDTFQAAVLECQPDGGQYRVVLDKTAFFPEGGGQYSDTGVLGTAKVVDVQEKGLSLIHI